MQIAPHLVLALGLAIFSTVLSANLVADGLAQWFMRCATGTPP